MKHIVALVLSALLLAFSFTPTRAVFDPPLFSCLQPIGTTIASYSSGTHGIPGNTGTFTGSDRVFNIDQSHVLQCFCPSDSSNGIQSNWWRITDLSEADQDFFVRRGWVYIPDGQPWGLAQGPYLVKNDSFQCNENGRGGNGGSSDGGIGGGVNGASDSQNRGGSILGASSLAGTGSTQKILVLASLGFLSAILAYRVSQG